MFAAKNPPMKIPATKNKFQDSAFQLYFKKGIPAGNIAAHTCRYEADAAKGLLSNHWSSTITSPINGPATYQGQGWLMNPYKVGLFDYA